MHGCLLVSQPAPFQFLLDAFGTQSVSYLSGEPSQLRARTGCTELLPQMMTRYEIQDVMTQVFAISIYGLYSWCNENMGKILPERKAFSSLHFEVLVHFLKTCSTQGRELQLKVSTVTRAQIVLMLYLQLHCMTVRHALCLRPMNG